MKTTLLGTAALVLASSTAQSQTAPTIGVNPAGTWETVGSDIPVDPAWRFGVLPNGIRYAVRRSTQPAGAISVRVRIGVGGLMEIDAQQGWSHLLEHMTFRGTKRYADGEGIRIWQRLGASFGSDTNAQTTLTATTYQLDLPRADPASYAQAMSVLADMMDSATIAPPLLETERRVVEAELAQRLSPLTRSIKDAQQPLLFAGTKAAVRDVMGTATTLGGADAKSLKAFYEAWYRPDNAVVVVAGDVDPTLLEAEVKRAFGAWRREAKPPAAPNWGAPTTPPPPVALVVNPKAPNTMVLDFVAPHPDEPMTSARQQRQFAEELAIGILGQRLAAMARRDDAVVTAGVQRIEQRHIEDQVLVPIQPKPGQWRKALDETYGVLNAATGRPPMQAEIDQQAAVMTARLKQQVASAATQTAPNLANGVVADVEQSDITGAPDYYLKLFEAQRKHLDPATIQATLKRLLAPAPRLLVISAQPIDGGAAALAAALGLSQKVAGAAAEQSRQVSLDQLKLMGTPAIVTGSTAVADLAADRVRFSNGVELLFKKTAFEKDRVRVRVSVGGGLLAQPFNDPGLWWSAPLLTTAGIGPFSPEEVARVVAGRQIAFAPQPGYDGLLLAGVTNGDDLADALKLMTGEIEQPRFDATTIDRIKRTIGASYASIFTQPLGVFSALSGPILHGGDDRFESLPPRGAIDGLTLAAFQGFWTARLAQGPVRVTIVGDVDRARAIDAVARTLGTLAPRAAVGPVRNDLPLVTALKPFVLHDSGDPGQAAVIRAWPTLGYFDDLKDGDALDVAAAIVQARLLEGFREKEGGSYTPVAAHQQTPDLPHYGAFLAGAQVQVGRVDDFGRSLDLVLADLAKNGPGADEFTRAQTTIASARARSREDNGWWTGVLSGDLTPERVKIAAGSVERIKAVTAETVKAAAAKYLRSSDPLTVEVLPGVTPGK